MTIEDDITTTLQGLVGNRLYPDVAPLGAVRPYITYQQFGGESVQFADSSLPSKENARFQINVWAATRTEAKALIKQAEAALCAATAFQTTPLGASVALHEPDTKLYGAMQDFSIWSTR